MISDDEKHEKQADEVFEVTLANEPVGYKLTNKATEARQVQEQLRLKIVLYKQCSSMYTYLKDSQIHKDEVIIQLPDQLHAKYIVKSIAYLADEWLTLRTNFIKQGETQHKLVVQLEHIHEEQIANMCSELNECIDHFIARAN